MVVNLSNRTTAVEKELLNRTLYYDMGQVQNYKYSVNYLGHIMLYLMTISEQHLSIYEVLVHKLEQFIEALDTLHTGHLPINLISPTQLKHMLNQVKKALQKTNPNYNLLFPDLYYYYDMKLVSFSYNKDFNLLFQFPIYIEPYTQKPLVLYQLESVPVPIKDNTETNLYTLNSAYNKVAFNKKLAIMKENLHTKYTPFTIMTSPLTKSHL